MKVANPGDWAKDALQLIFNNEKEYTAFIDSLTHQKLRFGQVAEVKGTELVCHYLYIEGKQTLAYVQENGAA